MTDQAISDVVYLIVGVLVLVGAFVTGKYGVRSAKASAEPGWDKFSSAVMARLTKVEQDNEHLRERIDGVERELRSVNRLLTSALGYIERLLDFIAEVFPGRRDTPPIPADLHDHLPPSLVSTWHQPPPPPPTQE